MYKRLDGNKHLTDEFRKGVYKFLQQVIGQEKLVEQDEILICHFCKCKCKLFKYADHVGLDLYHRYSCLIIIHGQIMVKNCHDLPNRC